MRIRLKDIVAWIGPALALGLYNGRFLSELWAGQTPTSWSLPIALAITAVTLTSAAYITYNHPLSQTWPLLLLWSYVFYPHPDLIICLAIGGLTAVCVCQTNLRPFFDKLGRYLPAAWQLPLVLLGTGVAFASLYIATLAPDILPADSGELQQVAVQLGIAHPPGFPLYTVLAHLLSWLPIGPTAVYRINLFSALTSTAVLLLLYYIVYHLSQRHLAALTAVIALGTATTFWSQATTANVRSLATLFAALSLWSTIRILQANTPATRDRWFVALVVAAVLGVGHHLSLAFINLVCLLFVLLTDPALLRQPKRWPRPLLAALLCLIPLLYLPLRAHSPVRGASPDLASWSGFVNHFLGLGFQGDFFYFIHPDTLRLRLGIIGQVLSFQFNPWLLLGMGIGLLSLFLGRKWRLGGLMLATFALHAFITATYRAPQTVEYMMPAYLPLAICLGVAVGQIQQLRWPTQSSPRPLATLFTAVMLGLALWQGWQHAPSFWQLHTAQDTRDYAQEILRQAPPNSLILANWHWVTPLWYLQEVEGQRPDLTIDYVAPADTAYGQTWADQIAAALANGRDVITTWYDPTTYANLPPAEPLGDAFWFRQTARQQLPADFTAVDQPLSATVHIVGVRLQQTAVPIGQTLTVTIAWQTDDPATAVPFHLHLIGPDGRSYAQSDQTHRPQPSGITLSQFQLTPRLGAWPGSYQLQLGHEQQTIPLTAVAVTAMSQPPFSQHRAYRPLATTDERLQLIGYDVDHTLAGQPRLYLHWQTTDGYVTAVSDDPATAVPPLRGPWGIPSSSLLPAWWPQNPLAPAEYYVPLADGIVWIGQPLASLPTQLETGKSYALPQQLAASYPLWRDYVVSTRLIGYETDGFHWAWCDLLDYVPAMSAIPSLKWIGGSVVSSPHQLLYADPAPAQELYCQSVKSAPGAPTLAVATNAIPGQTIGGTVMVYDAFTQRPLPILDERISSQFIWIPLGQSQLAP